MVETRGLNGNSNDFVKSNAIAAAPKRSMQQPVDAEERCNHSAELMQKTTDSIDNSPTKQYVKRYYVDELGFYRHLDPDQRQYVCSNINAANLRRSLQQSDNEHQRLDERDKVTRGGGGGGDGGYEICFRAIRSELGISHFDRTVGYNEWKQSWDEFMRSKLTKKEPVTLNNELKIRVRSGIPHDYRCKVWTALIRMRTRHIRALTGDRVYENILQRYKIKYQVSDDHDTSRQSSYARTSSTSPPQSPEIGKDAMISLSDEPVRPLTKSRSVAQSQKATGPRKFFRQIELDLLRTLPNNRHFEDPNSRGIQRVRRVLRAYACFNPTVGYCQGMNRLAAMALLILPEEEAFWCLVAITQCIMPKDYYLKPWLAQVDCYVLSDLLEKKMPKLHKHLIKNDIQLTLFSWFFTIFVDGFRPELMLRIWDCFLLEGDKVLFRFALAILYICQDDLLEMHDFSTMSAHLSQLVSTRRLDTEQLFEATVVKADLDSGTEDDDDSLDSTTGGAAMKHREEILNSLPKMPEVTTKAPSGKLQIGIKKRVENCERQARKGDSLHMHYRGSLKDGGAEFDNSYKRGQPLVFTLGTGQVIKGWDQGLLGICAGEKRRLVIPSHLAYGEMGSPPSIPPNSTLVFEVEAVKVEPGARLDL